MDARAQTARLWPSHARCRQMEAVRRADLFHLLLDALEQVGDLRGTPQERTLSASESPDRGRRGPDFWRYCVMIKLKRVYEKEDPDDGVRYLIERLWHRGVKKTSLRIDGWLKDAGPSTCLLYTSPSPRD